MPLTGRSHDSLAQKKGKAMTPRRHPLVFAALIVACSVLASAQTKSSDSVAQASPTIAKIDPPDWFVGLPDPMLLVRGTGFEHAQFKIKGESVSLLRTQVSDNGHWAFLWIRTTAAAAQTLQIIATSGQGQEKNRLRWRSDPMIQKRIAASPLPMRCT
jgi:hypothetical protein